MDAQRLLEAACSGNVDVVENLLENNPSILDDFKRKYSGEEALLYKVIKKQQLKVVRLLITKDPEGACEMSENGLRPLDVAVVIGNMRIVQEILGVDQNLCRLRSKGSYTAFHQAAVNGRVDIMDVMLNLCPDSIQDVTDWRWTALHLAVAFHYFDASAALLKWMKRLSKESMINMADCDGNTALHLAAFTKQYRFIILVLYTYRGIVDVNRRNKDGFTILDTIEIEDSYDIDIIQKLENAGAVRSTSLRKNNWFDYFKFQRFSLWGATLDLTNHNKYKTE